MHIDRAFAAVEEVAWLLFTIWCLVKGSREHASTKDSGEGVVSFGRAFRAWWFVTISLCAIGFSSDLFLGKVGPDEWMRFWRALGGFALLATLGTWIVLRYRVEWDEQAILVHSPLGTRRRIEWSEVVSVKQIKGTGPVIEIQAQKREVIPPLVSGATDFLQAARLRQRG